MITEPESDASLLARAVRGVFVLQKMAKQIKLFDCGVKSSANPSTSQTNVQSESTDKAQDELERRAKRKCVKSWEAKYICTFCSVVHSLPVKVPSK